jgi:hypothetical protein
MKLLSNVFIISVLIVGLITSSPLSFAQISNDTQSDTNNTNLGQQVSDFVHESRELFKQQKEETKEVIVQCREDMRNAEPLERELVREQCKANLEKIRESYKLFRETYREAFKEFRENMKVFIQESKGLPIDSSQRDAAIANIESLSDSPEKREMLRELQQKMDEEIRKEKQKLREEQKREREAEREARENSDDESQDDERELEIEVEIKYGTAHVKVEFGEVESEFEYTPLADLIDETAVFEEAVAKILNQDLGVSEEKIRDNLEIETEDDYEKDKDDSEEESEDNDSEESEVQ